MRLALVSTFDLGRSAGLGDDVFDPEQLAPDFDIGLVGYSNTLGRGVRVELAPTSQLAEAWRAEALAQSRRPEMETGWARSTLARQQFDDELRRAIQDHPITVLRMTVLAVGTVYLQLEFGPGVPIELAHGLLVCFEYAAYAPSLAGQMFDLADQRFVGALRDGRSGLFSLTERTAFETRTDRHGRTESDLVGGFTRLGICVDDGDGDHVQAICEVLGVGSENPVQFDYHGALHFGWAANVLVARTIADPSLVADVTDTPEEQVERLLAGIQVAQTFHATCLSFSALFTDEIRKQVGGYVADRHGGRPPQQLNQLRTLALAIVSFTNVRAVTATEEDLAYFARYEAHADLTGLQQQIQESCEVVYNVQVAEIAAQESERQDLLNLVVLLLTSLTIISVSVDAISFMREQEPLLQASAGRVWLLIFELAAIIVILLMLYRSRWRRG